MRSILFLAGAALAVATLTVCCTLGPLPLPGGPGGSGGGGSGGTETTTTTESSSDAGSGAEGGGDAAIDGCAIGDAGEPTDLACTGLYADWAAKTVAPEVTEYDPGLHLWSDGAEKTRWISLPPGTTIDTSNMDEWTFPVGTKVWKEFRLALTDGGTPQRIETRLLWKQSAGTWYRTTYRWSDDGASSATELTAGEMNAGGTTYQVPSQSMCDGCHNGRLDGVLGFEAVALSSPGASGITMASLVKDGLLTNPPTAPITIPGDPTQSAALAWLHVNCGQACHNTNQKAGGAGTGFFMRLDVATLGSVETTNTWITGWNAPAVDFMVPGVTSSYRFHACDVASSAAYYRASVRNFVNGVPNTSQMPPIDTHVVDTADLAAVAAWIDEGCDAGPADAGGDGP